MLKVTINAQEQQRLNKETIKQKNVKEKQKHFVK